MFWQMLKKKKMMNVRLFINRIKLSIQKRTCVQVNKKTRNAWTKRGYNNTPLVSVVVQSHNKSLQILHILPKLRAYSGVEIIVIDDGSDFVHTDRLVKALNGINEFVIRCNDLYENITYDRAIRFANGQYVALLQDDDDFDGAALWIEKAIAIFNKYNDLAILGGKWGYDLDFDVENGIVNNTRTVDGEFCYVMGVNRAPMWINRPLYLDKLKHIDFSYVPFQYDDYELCCRAWLNGLKVGWYNAGFHSLSVGGMRLWNNAFLQEQISHNGHLLCKQYADKSDFIKRKVIEANKLINSK